jgi:hypothetical protein
LDGLPTHSEVWDADTIDQISTLSSRYVLK